MGKKWVTISGNEFVADSLHKIANGLPPSQSEEARNWHEAADQCRSGPALGKVRIQVEDDPVHRGALGSKKRQLELH
jgi:hypothetical protein